MDCQEGHSSVPALLPFVIYKYTRFVSIQSVISNTWTNTLSHLVLKGYRCESTHSHTLGLTWWWIFLIFFSRRASSKLFHLFSFSFDISHAESLAWINGHWQSTQCPLDKNGHRYWMQICFEFAVFNSTFLCRLSASKIYIQQLN